MSNITIDQKWPAQHPDRIQLYSLNTPNGIKVAVALEEMQIPYEPHTINIMEGDQFAEEYKTVSPNSKIPVIVDPDGPEGKIGIMESGAILLYLGEKSGRFVPSSGQAKLELMQWLFFQVGHVGPMFGQFGHFYKFAKNTCDHPYPLERYKTETQRLLSVLETRLGTTDGFLLPMGYSIVDMATFPWLNTLKGFYEAGDILQLNDFPKTMDWLQRCLDRPAVQTALTVCAL